MKKKFVIQCATTKSYVDLFYNFSLTDNFFSSKFFDSEEEAEEALKNDFFDGEYFIILKVFVR